MLWVSFCAIPEPPVVKASKTFKKNIKKRSLKVINKFFFSFKTKVFTKYISYRCHSDLITKKKSNDGADLVNGCWSVSSCV